MAETQYSVHCYVCPCRSRQTIPSFISLSSRYDDEIKLVKLCQ
jgi:hypothetical protein